MFLQRIETPYKLIALHVSMLAVLCPCVWKDVAGVNLRQTRVSLSSTVTHFFFFESVFIRVLSCVHNKTRLSVNNLSSGESSWSLANVASAVHSSGSIQWSKCAN